MPNRTSFVGNATWSERLESVVPDYDHRVIRRRRGVRSTMLASSTFVSSMLFSADLIIVISANRALSMWCPRTLECIFECGGS